MKARDHQALRWALLTLLGLGGLRVAEAGAQVPERPVIGTEITHVRSITPRSGPAGMSVAIRADGLPIDTRVYVALAAVHSGYEVGATTQTSRTGELTAAITVPEQHRNHWDHTQVIVVLAEEGSRVMAMSDPFHITNEEGFVQRSGVIGIADHGCPILRGFDGYEYAIVGRSTRSLAASAGHQLTVEGAIVEGTCGLQDAIEVARMREP